MSAFLPVGKTVVTGALVRVVKLLHAYCESVT